RRHVLGCHRPGEQPRTRLGLVVRRHRRLPYFVRVIALRVTTPRTDEGWNRARRVHRPRPAWGGAQRVEKAQALLFEVDCAFSTRCQSGARRTPGGGGGAAQEPCESVAGGGASPHVARLRLARPGRDGGGRGPG